MRILVVAATGMEIAPLVESWRERPRAASRTGAYEYAGHDVDLLMTGVGMVPTAVWCSRTLCDERYDFCLNVGLCGSFDRGLTPAAAVHVVSDCFSEMGAEDGDRFLSLQELKLAGDNEFPFTAGRLVNAAPPANVVLSRLPAVDGITVNTVHGRDASIDDVRRRFAPSVESMEGAAFMYACLVHGLPFAQVRAVSNVVERRNRAAWNIPGAIRSLTEVARRILEHA